MAEPVAGQSMIIRISRGGGALRFVARLICPTIVTGMVAALIAIAGKPAVVPLACTTNWTTVGRTIIFSPDCSNPAPPSASRAPSG